MARYGAVADVLPHSATDDRARDRGINAGDLVRTASQVLKGGSGGKPDIAQGAGTNPLAILDALQKITRTVKQAINQ